MIGEWEIHKRVITILAYIAGVIGGVAFTIYVLTALVGLEATLIITIGMPAFLGLYWMMYTQAELEKMQDEKWKEFHEDIMKNGRYRPD
jgi:uncharacterized membrane protein